MRINEAQQAEFEAACDAQLERYRSAAIAGNAAELSAVCTEALEIVEATSIGQAMYDVTGIANQLEPLLGRHSWTESALVSQLAMGPNRNTQVQARKLHLFCDLGRALIQFRDRNLAIPRKELSAWIKRMRTASNDCARSTKYILQFEVLQQISTEEEREALLGFATKIDGLTARLKEQFYGGDFDNGELKSVTHDEISLRRNSFVAAFVSSCLRHYGVVNRAAIESALSMKLMSDGDEDDDDDLTELGVDEDSGAEVNAELMARAVTGGENREADGSRRFRGWIEKGLKDALMDIERSPEDWPMAPVIRQFNDMRKAKPSSR